MALLSIEEPISTKETLNEDSTVIIGIDLGTTNSLVATIQNEQVVFFCDAAAQAIHPSIVLLNKAGEVVTVGNQAALLGAYHAQRNIGFTSQQVADIVADHQRHRHLGQSNSHVCQDGR